MGEGGTGSDKRERIERVIVADGERVRGQRFCVKESSETFIFL